ncbi:DUF3427 domain-containing protein [Bifidobacterium sp. ESL0784]|uniref:DUF3427 domain-containing protein n=1 Tax=Bifidobacterium sp. ESL0784 TaxID=2983231 RepID=UPI0023F8DF16|nr:DUF3427 domain-containing protein [Bifidobacterium sp. ESL0784]MDF7640552.1 DUF3427 domain-containing protein [Bifidobacterium sp. ESL0784]
MTEQRTEKKETNFETTSSNDSLVEAITSGFIRQNLDADSNLTPTLIANRNGLTMEEAIESELEQCHDFDLSVAFVNNEELKSLKQYLLNFDKDKSQRSGRIITSTYNYFNKPEAFKTLLQIQKRTNIKIFIWQSDSENHSSMAISNYRYHPKGYVFRHRTENGKELDSTYIGSSNLTSSALKLNKEWNLRVSSQTNSGLTRQINSEINAQLSESVKLTNEWLKQYEEEFEHYAPPQRILPQPENGTIEPNAMQQEALMNLAQLRKAGESQAIIVSATGTGKTYLSAFDVRQFKPNRMLYVAQQQQILKKSMESYQKVLGCEDQDLGLLSGTSKQGDRKYVFATVQTLANNLDSFDSDSFDYILIDEAHHSAADSYRKVLRHFTPRFLLGMTATPERTDDADIFGLFGNNIAYNIRLQRALEENMLCTFHYYGVHEYIEDKPDPNTIGELNKRIDVTQTSERTALNEWIQKLVSADRVHYIIDKLQTYEDPGNPVKGLVFCSLQKEAKELSTLFNARWNQQAERKYHTVAVTGDNAVDRDSAVKQLENGELDYIFTVDLFNEGVDIPALNQIVMLRQTKSSIIFTQQLGRGLRKYPGKESVTIIDFIGNYANNYLIPIALYGNTGDRDIARKNLQRKSIGLSSVSFDPIAEKKVLASIDKADLSQMQLLSSQYRQLRNQLNRIPMLTDFAKTDPSLIYTLADKKDSYLQFVRSREQSLSRGNSSQASYAETLKPTNAGENGALKMLTSTLLRGLRPHELLVLANLCDITVPNSTNTSIEHKTDRYQGPSDKRTLSIEELGTIISNHFPKADNSAEQRTQSFHVLDLSYFITKNKERFGGKPLVKQTQDNVFALADWLYEALRSNSTFATFFADTVQAGLINCDIRFEKSPDASLDQTRGFIYGEKYSIFDVMRLCGWKNEQVPQNVGGYKLDLETSSLPIFIKYEASQYGDRFINTSELKWFSKNQRTLHSNEFVWLLNGIKSTDWQRSHFVPIFIRRRQEEKEKTYYYVGNVASISGVRPDHNLDDNGKELNVVVSTLRLSKPVDPELFRHLTGKSAL